MTVYGFNRRADVARVGAAVREVEAGRQPDERRRSPLWFSYHIAKTTVEHANDDTRPCEIYRGDAADSLSPSGEEIDCYNRGATIPDDTWVFAILMPWGFEILVAEEV